jgi:membrane fusion protein (multidrug efflux system)
MAGLIIASACQHETHHVQEETTYLVTKPVKKDTVIFNHYVGRLEAIQHIELRAMEKGYLKKIHIDEGQPVKKGQLMFEVMPTIYQAEMDRALAESNLAQLEFQNTKSLADSNIVSQNEFALSRAELDKANAHLKLAKAHLDFTKIKAPFDGIMGRFHVRLGSLLDEGELLTTLADNSQIWAYFNVPEAEYLDLVSENFLKNMPQVNLEMANGKTFKNKGTIETIEADFNRETGNIAFRATFPNENKILRHGETGNILLPTEIKDALFIPQKATFEVLDRKYVFVIDKDDRVTQREITVEREIPHLYAVNKGLSVNDKILVEGLRKVKKDQKIKYELIDQKRVQTELNRLHAE